MADSFTDLQMMHAIFLQRYSNGVDREIQKLLLRLEKDVSEKLGQRLATIDKRGHDLGPTVTKRLEKTIDEIRELNSGVYDQTKVKLEKRLTELAEAEMDYTGKALRKSGVTTATAAIASPQRLKSIVSERPIMGKLLEPFVREKSAGTIGRIEEVIRGGMATGKSLDEMVREIRSDKTMGVSKRAATALVRTSVTHVSNHAQMETFLQNSGVVKGWEFLATLDTRTTIICASLDGKVFPLGSGPLPPRHIHCRSTITAVTDEAELSGRRASDEGTVTDSNYEAWLKRQPEAKQDTVLGKTRADLWRDGRYSLSDFVRNNREVLTLDQLKATYPKVEAEPIAKRFDPKTFNPRASTVTADSITVQARADIAKALTAKFKKAEAAHPFPITEFRGRNGTPGKAALGRNFDDETASMIAAIMPEVDAISDAFAIPRIRGITTIRSKASADMGDAVLGINPTTFNGYAGRIAGADPLVKIAELENAQAALRTNLNDVADRAQKATSLTDRRAFLAEHKKLRSEWVKLNQKINRLNNAGKPVSTWKPGASLKDRPWGTAEYFESIDKARAIMFHEMAHHVHQKWKRTGYRKLVGKPPLEIELTNLYRRKVSEQTIVYPTRYAQTDQFEWFAESCALWMMDRKELIDPDIIILIERLLDEANNG